jgi:hypothetical protein
MPKKLKATHHSESIYMELHPDQMADLCAMFFMDLYTQGLLNKSTIMQMSSKSGLNFNGFKVSMDLTEGYDKSICVSYDGNDEAALIYFSD